MKVSQITSKFIVSLTSAARTAAVLLGLPWTSLWSWLRLSLPTNSGTIIRSFPCEPRYWTSKIWQPSRRRWRRCWGCGRICPGKFHIFCLLPFYLSDLHHLNFHRLLLHRLIPVSSECWWTWRWGGGEWQQCKSLLHFHKEILCDQSCTSRPVRHWYQFSCIGDQDSSPLLALNNVIFTSCIPSPSWQILL